MDRILVSLVADDEDREVGWDVGWWDVSRGRPIRAAKKNNLRPALISANGSTWVVRDRATYRFYDGAGKERGHITLKDRDQSKYAGDQFEAAISPDGRRFAACNNEAHLGVWDIEATPRSLFSFDLEERVRLYQRCINALKFSPNGRFLAGVREDETIQLLHSATGQRKLEIKASHSAFSPDGLWLATGRRDGTMALCDAESGGLVMKLAGHPHSITQLHFARTIRTLLSVSMDRTALMWSLRPELPNPLPKPDALWVDLANRDAAKAYRAFWGCIEQPDCVEFLSRKLFAEQKAFDGPRVRKWLSELDDRNFAVRDAASEGLEKLGPSLEPVLRREWESATSAEKRHRLTRLLDACGKERPPEQLRLSRAVSALAEIGTPAAKQALQELAKGDDAAPLTTDAKAALKRLAD